MINLYKYISEKLHIGKNMKTGIATYRYNGRKIANIFRYILDKDVDNDNFEKESRQNTEMVQAMIKWCVDNKVEDFKVYADLEWLKFKNEWPISPEIIDDRKMVDDIIDYFRNNPDLLLAEGYSDQLFGSKLYLLLYNRKNPRASKLVLKK